MWKMLEAENGNIRLLSACDSSIWDLIYKLYFYFILIEKVSFRPLKIVIISAMWPVDLKPTERRVKD